MRWCRNDNGAKAADMLYDDKDTSSNSRTDDDE